MQPDFIPLDWSRMFWGEAPPLFLVEIAVRTVIVYLYTLALIRWIGGRGIGQMSIVEFLLVVALGSAVGDAMFYPDVPLIHALLVITVAVGINKLIDLGMWYSEAFRRVFAGRTLPVIAHGRINLANLYYLKVSRDELFEALREQGIRNVARVSHGYLESSGKFSFFQVKGKVRGLSIMPLWEPNPMPAQPDEDLACCVCAAVAPPATARCPSCGATHWAAAEVDSP